MRRPAQVAPRSPPAEEQIRHATYVGSAEHKERRWWGGLPRAHRGADGEATRPRKQHTTICPLVATQDRAMASGWVQEALRSGRYRFLEADQAFPSRIWYKQPETGQLWLGYCINTVAGHYKGWPIEEAERHAIFG